MARDAVLGSIRKLKDTTNQPLWQPSMQAGVPDTILGYPITVNNDMPAMAANAYSILFGDFQRYYIVRQVRDIQMLRLEERYADFLQVGFLAFARYDGTKDDTNAVKAYRNSAS
jgi:HK97 family phage major capsid protein